MPNYSYKCQTCGHDFDSVVKYDERDNMQPCEECGKDSVRKMVMPTVMKAAYPDGHKRKGWADMVATAKLAEAKANSDYRSSDVKDINKELNEREKRTKVKVTKD